MMTTAMRTRETSPTPAQTQPTSTAPARFSPEMDQLAAHLSLLGNDTRLKLFWLLANIPELCVCDLAERLNVTVSAISQHLSKFKAYGLMKTRRDASTIYYSLTEHPFNEMARGSILVTLPLLPKAV